MPRRNVGGIDRVLRVAAGAILLPAGIVLAAGGHPPGWTLAIVGALLLASGALGFCPPYVLLGISTARPPCAGRCPGTGGERASR